MSSTNKTSHYNLPQFIGSDIPTWLGDFNSAMTAIDSGINAAATSASEAATTAAQALEATNRCPFPIGYGGFFQINPNTLYKSTTWEQKKNVFILAAGETYPAGSTGGEAKHMLAEKELPYVSGHISFVSNGLTQGIIAANESSDAGAFSYSQMCSGTFASNSEPGDGNGARRIDFNLGANEPHNNMPPYFAMPFWVRTA